MPVVGDFSGQILASAFLCRHPDIISLVFSESYSAYYGRNDLIKDVCLDNLVGCRATIRRFADLDSVYKELDALSLFQATEKGNTPHGLVHALLRRLVQVSNHIGHRQPE